MGGSNIETARASVEERRRLLERLLRERAARARTHPPSFAQERLWFIDRLNPGQVTYSIPAAARVRGALDADALARALDVIVARHEILRTTFPAVDGRPVQQVAPSLALPLERVDLTAWPATRREWEVRARAAAEARRPFDLERGPLVRATLLALGPDEHVLLFCMHHIVSDGWSMGVLVREIAAIYPALVSGRPHPLPELPIQYADFATWQRAELDGERLAGLVDWWTEHLAGAPVVELPSDRPRPPVQSFRGAELPLEFPAEVADAVRRLGAAASATPFTVWFAAFAALLARWTGQTDVVVGTPVACRTRPELHALIGLFANTLALRVDLGGRPTFRELVSRVREVVSGALEHQELPFERLVEALHPRRDLSRSPLFQMMFVLQNLPTTDLRLASDVRLEPVSFEAGTSRFDLTLILGEREGRTGGTLEYNADLFEPGTARRFAAAFRTLVTAAVAAPDTPVGELPAMALEERRRVLHDWNDTRREPLSWPTAQALIEARAAANPQAIAIDGGDETLSYGELVRRARQVARRLRAQGAGPETIVAIAMGRSLETFVVTLGVLRAGAAFLPLDPDYPPERLAFMIEDSRARLVVTERALAARLTAPAARVLHVEDLAAPAAGDGDGDGDGEEDGGSESWPAVAGDQLAYVIYTSGSTGRPKGTLLAHAGLCNLIRFQERALEIGSSSRVLQFAAASYDASVWEVFSALGNGATLVVAHSDELAPGPEFVRLLRERRVTHLTLPPSVLAVLDPSELPELTTLVLAGERCPAELVARWAPGRRLLNAYGPTETTVCATTHLCVGAEGDPPIGRPIDGFRAYVLDLELEPVPPGVIGELYLGGPGLARGYLGRADLTAERFVPDPFGERGARLYRTGDLGSWLASGELSYAGRSDHQVKLRGFRIELGEIEAALGALPGVRQAAVALVDGAGGEPALAAWVTAADGVTLDPQELSRALGTTLPEFMVPASIDVVEAFPLSPSGKLDRAALRSTHRASAAAGWLAPRTPDEQALSEIWSELLGIARVGAGDDFFALGGHSLLAARLASRVRDRFGVELPLRKIFERPTVAGLAEELSRARVAAIDPIPSVPRTAGLALSFAQERIWFLDRLVPGSAFYNMPAAVRLRGPFDPAVLARALGEVVRRHEILRTRFPSREGAPALEIDPPAPVDVAFDDLSELDARERERALAELGPLEARRPFDLANGPLVRARVVRLGQAEHVLWLTLHHIVGDGWSVGILVRELAAAYAAFTGGVAPALPEPRVQYADFAAWQRERLTGERLGEDLAYWKTQLGGLAVLELPTDRPRPAVRTFRGAAWNETWPVALAERLKVTSDRHGVTPFMTLLATCQLLLSRYSGQLDFAIGSPVAGRERSELEELIGCFVNTLVLRTELAGDPTFAQLLARVRETALGAFAHQELPFERLVDELAPARDLSRESLFQVMFVMQNVPYEPLALPGGTSVEPLELAAGTAKFELTFAFATTDRGLAASVQYNSDLYDGTTIERMTGHFRQLLEQALASPEGPVSELSPFTGEERTRLLHAWNSREESAVPFEPVHRQFERRAREAPAALAVEDGDGALSYGELDREASRLARRLRALGAGPESVIGVATGRGVPLAVAALAILKAGAAYLPLDPGHPRRRLAGMLDDARVRIVVTLARHASVFEGASSTLVIQDEPQGVLDGDATDVSALPVAPEQLAYVIYTSGSTGRPKGVAVPHRGLANLVRWHLAAYDLGPSDRTTQIAAETFDASVWELWPALAAGASLHVAADALRLDPDALLGWLLERGITLSFLPTPLAEAVLERDWPDGTSLRALLTGGDRLHRARSATLPVRVVNHYGPTENAVVATAGDVVDEGDGRLPAIGRPIAGVEVYLLDAGLEPVPLGAAGELYVGGASLARGYVGRPELTAERFVPHPFGPPGARLYRTGDRCRRRQDGSLDFLDRADSQLKLRGYRVEPGEIEAALAEHGGVKRALVLADAGEAGARLVAYFVPEEGAPAPAAATLREHLAERLPDYMVPSVLVPLAELPLTAHGKIDRSALPAAGAARASAEHVAPRTELERQLAEIWSEVLGAARVGVEDNFFELGGHSLASVRVADAIGRRLGRHVAVTTLFRHPTIAALAQALETAAADGGDAGRVLVELRPGPRDSPPLFLVHQDTGLALGYLPLAQRLPDGFGVWGLEAPGLAGAEPVLDTVEAMAARYVEAVRAVAPHGPYRLGGHSFGGYVAYEMARRLEQHGEQVRSLLLLDTSPPGARKRAATTYDDAARLAAQARALERFLGLPLGIDERALRALAPEEQIATFLARTRDVRGGLAPGPQAVVADMLLAGGAGALTASLAIGRACAAAALAYRPDRPWDGTATLFRSSEADPSLPPATIADPALGWGAFAREVVVHRVRGDHQSMIVEPDVADLASRIEDALGAKHCAEENGR